MRIALAAALLATGAPASAAFNAYYCWAPDAASGKVFMSEVRTGGVPDRVAFAPKWAAWLRASGRAQGDIQPICTMRETADEVARARAALPVESCRECGTARDFVDATMAGGSTPPPRPKAAAIVVRHETGPKTEYPWIIAWGNNETGRIVWATGPNSYETERRVAAKAYANKKAGWAPLVASRSIGFGAAMCTRDKSRVRFFTVYPRASFKDAVTEARQRAELAARATGQQPFLCGGWLANDPTGKPAPATLIDLVRGGIRLLVTSSGKSEPICVNHRGRIISKGDGSVPGTGRCAVEFVRSSGASGVRG